MHMCSAGINLQVANLYSDQATRLGFSFHALAMYTNATQSYNQWVIEAAVRLPVYMYSMPNKTPPTLAHKKYVGVTACNKPNNALVAVTLTMFPSRSPAPQTKIISCNLVCTNPRKKISSPNPALAATKPSPQNETLLKDGTMADCMILLISWKAATRSVSETITPKSASIGRVHTKAALI